MRTEPLDDDYRVERPPPDEELICPHCGDYFVVGCCIRCELAIEKESEVVYADPAASVSKRERYERQRARLDAAWDMINDGPA